MAETHKKYGPSEQVAAEVFRDLSTSYESLSLRILRQNDRGQFQTVYSNMTFKTADMPDLDAFLKPRAGGGKFFVEVRRPDDKTSVIFTYHLPIEGSPRPPMPLDEPEPERTFVGYVMPSFAGDSSSDDDGSVSLFPHLPPVPAAPGEPMSDQARPQTSDSPLPAPDRWARGLAADARRGYAAAAGVATIPSDQLAMAQAQERAAENARLRAEKEAMQQRFEDRLRALETQLQQREREVAEARARAEREALEARHQASLASLEAKLEAMKMVSQRPAEPPKQDFANLIAALAPLAPVLVALIQSNRDSTTKALEIQHQGMNAVMTAALSTANKPAPDPLAGLKELLPLALPLIQNMIQSKSPEAQAQLISAMADSQMQSAAMYAQLLETMAQMGGPSEPKSMVQELLPHVFGGLQKLAEAMMTAQTQNAPMPAARGLPSGAMPQQQVAQPRPQAPTSPQAPSAAYRTLDVSDASGPVNPTSDMTSAPAAADVNQLLTFLPEPMRSAGWRSVLSAMHRGQSSRAVGKALCDVLIDDMQHGRLPPDIVSGFEKSPVDTLRNLAQFLPINAANPTYVESVIFHTIDSLTKAIHEAQAEAAAHVVTPAMTPAMAAEMLHVVTHAGDDEEEGDDEDDDEDDDEEDEDDLAATA